MCEKKSCHFCFFYIQLQPSCTKHCVILQLSMHRKLPIFSTWIATLMVLLSTVVMHHHHYERVCIALETCADEIEQEPEESHSHQENGGTSCQVHQLHKFIVSTGTAKAVHRHMASGHASAALAASAAHLLAPNFHNIIAHKCGNAVPLSCRALTAVSRRGPPQFSLS